MLSPTEVVIIKELSNVLHTRLSCLAPFATCARLDHFLCCFGSLSVEVILQSKNLTPDHLRSVQKTGLNGTRMKKEQILILKNY